jgi:type I restriction enzyme, S subunit
MTEWRTAGRPIIRIQDLTGTSNRPNFYDGEVAERHVVKTGDLLVSWAATLGAFIWRGPEGVLNQHIFRVKSFIDKRFHHVLVQHVLEDMRKRAHGTGMVHITKDEFDRTTCPVPPLAEQSRIVDGLDELLSDLEAGVASLEGARAKLKAYRASVLKGAVDGTLTAEWREEHQDVESASALLDRILTERRERWAAEQLAKFETKGQRPPKTWKAKYKEPVGLQTSLLPRLPAGWSWASFEQFVWRLRSGSAESSVRTPTDYPVLKSSAVRHGVIDFSDVNYLHRDQSSNRDNFLRRGDFLITRLSGSVDYVGCAAWVDQPPSVSIQYPDRIFCAKVVTDVHAGFLTYCMQHPRIRHIIEAAAKSTAGHQRISISDLTDLPVPLPPREEQEAIVEIVEDQLSVIEHLETDLDAKLKAAQSLRQSILRHALTGQLVPQDPKDEPASELLERIAAEREARQAAERKKSPAPRRKRAATRRP